MINSRLSRFRRIGKKTGLVWRMDSAGQAWHASAMFIGKTAVRLAISALMLVAGKSVAQASTCGLALVLATDVSSSIDEREYRLQMDGLAAAFRAPVLREALLGTPGQVVQATVVHWSGFHHQEQVVPWQSLSSPAAIDGFASALAAVPRTHADQPTALSKGLQFSAKLLEGMPCDRRIIDLSGDGVANWGVEPSYFAERGLFDDLTINGLVIKGADPDPEPYYRENVARGPGAFVMVAQDYAAYPETILEKLLREIVPRVASVER